MCLLNVSCMLPFTSSGSSAAGAPTWPPHSPTPRTPVPALCTALPAQVCLLHVVVLHEVLRGALERDAAGLHHVSAARELERHVGVLLDHQHRGPLALDARDDLEDRL